MSNTTTQVSILGGGLAGTFLAAALCKRNYQVTLIDDQHPKSATRVAGGLFNIITGRLASKTWMAEDLLQAMTAFFEQPEFAHLKQFLHFQKIYRPFRTIQALNEWTARTLMPEFKKITELSPQPVMENAIQNPYGGLWILPSGWAETAQITDGIKAVLEKKYNMAWKKGTLDYSAIDVSQKQYTFQGEAYAFDHFFFAEGVRVKTNPWFEWIDLRPLKGQVLEVEIPGFEPGFILSKKVFLIPKGNHRFVCGSTYERWYDDAEPTPAGIEEITGHLRKAISLPFEVVGASAGIRPTTPNRRPICGTHPEHDFFHIFNGLGTKGWLQAPYFSEHFVQHFAKKTDYLIKDIRLSRFLK